jgi:hypothetical protein
MLIVLAYDDDGALNNHTCLNFCDSDFGDWWLHILQSTKHSSYAFCDDKKDECARNLPKQQFAAAHGLIISST